MGSSCSYIIIKKLYRNSHWVWGCSARKAFAKFTGKHLCRSRFFNKTIVSLMLAILLKKRLRQRCFPVNFAEFVRTPVFIEHNRWLLQTRLTFTEDRPEACNFIKKESLAQVFSYEFCEISRNTFSGCFSHNFLKIKIIIKKR